MKNKKTMILIISSIVIIVLIFFTKNNYKFSKRGNNISNKSADEIKEYVLNIESYEAEAKIVIKSNKNENTYLVTQKYHKEGNIYKQEVQEPQKIAGVQFIYDGTNLKVENKGINLNKIYEKYNYIESNELSLASFIEDFKESNESKCVEENVNVILEIQVKDGNKYTASKKLYINREKGKIEKMEIKDRTQNTRVYILYNKIEINTLQKEQVLALSNKY